MTRVFAVDENNDLYLNSQGNLAINVDLQAVLQNCEHAAKSQTEEMIYAYDEGVPNFQTIWNGAPNIAQWQSAMRRTLLAVNGVLEVVSLEVQTANNVLSYSAIIRTIYGEGVLNG